MTHLTPGLNAPADAITTEPQRSGSKPWVAPQLVELGQASEDTCLLVGAAFDATFTGGS